MTDRRRVSGGQRRPDHPDRPHPDDRHRDDRHRDDRHRDDRHRDDRQDDEMPHREYGPGNRRGPMRSGGGYAYGDPHGDDDRHIDEIHAGDPRDRRRAPYDTAMPPGHGPSRSLHGGPRHRPPGSGGPDHTGKGPRGYRRSDERIREDVSDRLTDAPRLDASRIEVSVVDGEVTLDGEVDSKACKREAEDCADVVSGVRHVQNNLRLRGSR